MKIIKLQVPVPQARQFDRPDNVVVTSKYTPWDFVPRAVSLQFRRAVNIYYLIQVFLLAIAYFIPNLFESPFTPFGTLGVLSFVIGVTLIFEGGDDMNRHRQDNRTNSRPVVKIDPDTGKKLASTWGEIRPGDLVYLKNRDLVPTDMMIVQSSHANGMIYIETSGIDGETNLKLRRVPLEFVEYCKETKCEGMNVWRGVIGEFEYEEPNPFLSFSGTFIPANGKNKIPLGFEAIVLRGSEVRNTEWVIGCALYTGHETKLVLSKRPTPSKFSTMDKMVNKLIPLTVLEQFVVMTISVVMLFVFTTNTKTLWYMKNEDVLQGWSLPGIIAYILTFFTIFSNFVPINLYVNVEIANFLQSKFLEWDLDMYDEYSDTPAKTKTTNLISEIGQISHVFSDKTGTLTQNVMRLVGLSINGERFGIKVKDAVKDVNEMIAMKKKESKSEDGLGQREVNTKQIFSELQMSSSSVQEVLLLLSLCHTVVIDLDEEKKPRYNAEGPDEEALVKAAAELGYQLFSTENNIYQVNLPNGKKIKVTLLAVNVFTSDRKRMSVLVKDELSGKITLYLKGADSIVAERANNVDSKTQNNLDAFAQSGLRTLLLAKREIEQSEANDWLGRFQKAKSLVGNDRHVALEKLGEEIEKNLTIVGASAIEDALQVGVPETISLLRQADIKVWVLTGDKVDTAINIGFSCKLLDTGMTQFMLDGSTKEELVSLLQTYVDGMKKAIEGEIDLVKSDASLINIEKTNCALVATGKAMENILERQKGDKESQKLFLELAMMCDVVLACR